MVVAHHVEVAVVVAAQVNVVLRLVVVAARLVRAFDDDVGGVVELVPVQLADSLHGRGNFVGRVRHLAFVEFAHGGFFFVSAVADAQGCVHGIGRHAAPAVLEEVEGEGIGFVHIGRAFLELHFRFGQVVGGASFGRFGPYGIGSPVGQLVRAGCRVLYIVLKFVLAHGQIQQVADLGDVAHEDAAHLELVALFVGVKDDGERLLGGEARQGDGDVLAVCGR